MLRLSLSSLLSQNRQRKQPKASMLRVGRSDERWRKTGVLEMPNRPSDAGPVGRPVDSRESPRVGGRRFLIPSQASHENFGLWGLALNAKHQRRSLVAGPSRIHSSPLISTLKQSKRFTIGHFCARAMGCIRMDSYCLIVIIQVVV